MAIMDEKLQETRKNIEELENGLNYSLLKKETKSKSESQTFNVSRESRMAQLENTIFFFFKTRSGALP